MKINAYSPRTGTLISEGVTGITFGNVKQGLHCVVPIVIKPIKTSENEFTQMKVFLQNNGGFNSSNFGYFLSSTFVTGVAAGSSYLSDNFVLEANPSATGVNGVELDLVSGIPADYVWLDVQVGALETGSSSTINYRFSFDFN